MKQCADSKHAGTCCKGPETATTPPAKVALSTKPAHATGRKK